MIYVITKGRLGNNLFQYFFSKILSEKIGMDFSTEFLIPQELGIVNKQHSFTFKDFSILREVWNGNQNKLYLDDNIIEKNINVISEEIIKKGIKNILLDGFFQQYSYYENYEDLIKSSFLFHKNEKKDIVGIHVRKGDIIKTVNDLPDEWFINMCNKFPNKRKIICTDTIENPLIKKLITLGCELYINTPEKTIIEFSSFENLILSQGTFSWWIGFLSKGVKHSLITQNGWNSFVEGSNLYVNDKKWIYYK